MSDNQQLPQPDPRCGAAASQGSLDRAPRQAAVSRGAGAG
jgi:hypothetical protein